MAPSRASLAVRLLAMPAATPTQGEDPIWWPGKPNPRQLPGTLRTLDGVDGATSLRCDELPAAARLGLGPGLG